MILPPRRAPVDTNRRAEIRAALEPDEVVQRIDNLIDRNHARLVRLAVPQPGRRLLDDRHPIKPRAKAARSGFLQRRRFSLLQGKSKATGQAH